MSDRKLIKNSLIMTFMDDGYTAIKIIKSDMLIVDNIIVRIQRDLNAEDCEIIDGEGMLSIPGLINSRSRALVSKVSKSIAEDINCDRYNNTPIYHRINPYVNAALKVLNEEEIKAILKVALYEAIEGGTTTLFDQGTLNDTEYLLELCKQIGIRVVAAPSLISRTSLPVGDIMGNIENEIQDADEKSLIEYNVSLIKKYNTEMAKAAIGLYNCEALSDNLIKKAAQAAKEYNTHLIFPCNETKIEKEYCIKRFEISPLQRFEKNGALFNKTILGSMTYTDEKDYEIAKNYNVNIAHCPMQAALDGVFEKMVEPLSYQINTALGTGRCPINMLEQLKVCSLVGKLEFKKRYKVRGTYVYYAAIEAGAQIFGNDKLGRLIEGSIADIVMLKINEPHLTPFTMPLVDLLYSYRTQDVVNVMVNGNFIMKSGVVLGIDKKAMLEKANLAFEKLWVYVRQAGVY